MFWSQEDLQPLRNTSMAEKLSGKWPMTGCHVEPPTQASSAQDLTQNSRTSRASGLNTQQKM